MREFVRVVTELEASYFVFENVKGLTLGKQVRFLNELVEEFRARGYEVLESWRVLNAVEYGAPVQFRGGCGWQERLSALTTTA